MQNKSKYPLLSFAIFLILILSSCRDSNQFSDLSEYINQIKQGEANKADNSVLITPPIPHTYQADNLRAPFQSANQQIKSKGTIVAPLEVYPLSVLRFVGTVSQNHKISFAYIVSPDNMTYQVKNGDIIGDRKGKIVSINADSINVMEQDIDDKGHPAMRIVTMQLKEIH